jgi:hypothetical protein
MSDDKAQMRQYLAQQREGLERDEQEWSGAVITSSDPALAGRPSSPVLALFKRRRKFLDDMEAALERMA